MFELVHEARTDIGRKRDNNEDAFAVDTGHEIFVVCDGMGGHASGEIASALATETLLTFFTDTCRASNFEWPETNPADIPFEEQALRAGIHAANHKIHEAAVNDSALEGMGTTVCAIASAGNHLFLAHVGDSRIYRYRGGQLSPLTEDHSLINHYKHKEGVSQEELDAIKGRSNVIVRAVGLRTDLEVDLRVEEKQNGDIYLLCTDGLTDLVSDADIEEIFRQHKSDLAKVTEALIDEANSRGGKDNITVLLLSVSGEPDPVAPPTKVELEKADTLREYDIDHQEFDKAALAAEATTVEVTAQVPLPPNALLPTNDNIIIASGTVDLDSEGDQLVVKSTITVPRSGKSKAPVALVPPPAEHTVELTRDDLVLDEGLSSTEDILETANPRIDIKDPDLRDIVLRSQPTPLQEEETE